MLCEKQNSGCWCICLIIVELAAGGNDLALWQKLSLDRRRQRFQEGASRIPGEEGYG